MPLEENKEKNENKKDIIIEIEELLEEESTKSDLGNDNKLYQSPNNLSKLTEDLLFELLSGDAIIHGLTNLSYDYLKNLKGSVEDCTEWGIISFNKGLFELALNYFNKYFKLRDFKSEEDIYLLNCKGRSHLRLGQLEDALISFNRILEINPNDPNASNNIRLVLYKKGDFRKAKKFFEDSINSDPTKAIFHWNLSLTQMKLNNINEALKSLEKTVKLKNSYKNKAYNHELFTSIKDNPKFLKIVLNETMNDNITSY
ncbi:MAG: tetratricopeptide repeat protein [Promethearchaeia archaeon]